MPLLRQNSIIVWQNYSASAGERSPKVDVSKVQFLTIYVEVSAATTIYLDIYACNGWKQRDSLTFSGAGYDFWEIWANAWDIISFRTSNAVTITIEVKFKT